MEDGYHVNVARNCDKQAWDSTPSKLKYERRHYCSIYLGRVLESEAVAMLADLIGRFPEGDLPGQFELSLTHWQSVGQRVQVIKGA